MQSEMRNLATRNCAAQLETLSFMTVRVDLKCGLAYMPREINEHRHVTPQFKHTSMSSPTDAAGYSPTIAFSRTCLCVMNSWSRKRQVIRLEPLLVAEFSLYLVWAADWFTL